MAGARIEEREYKKDFEVYIKKVDGGCIMTASGRESVSYKPSIDISGLVDQLAYGEELIVSVSSLRYKKDNEKEE